MDGRAPEAVIFDLDGVLVDSHAAVTGAMNAALVEHGLPARPQSQLRRMIGPPTFVSFAQLTGEPIDSAAVAEIVSSYRERYAAVYLNQTRVFDGVPEMLATLAARLPLAIATSKSVLFTAPLLDALGLTRFFTAVEAASADDTSDDKQAIVGRALRTLGRPAATAMVGDRSFDMAAAKAHGLLAIGVLWGIGDEAELRSAGADVLAEEPSNIPKLLGVETLPAH